MTTFADTVPGSFDCPHIMYIETQHFPYSIRVYQNDNHPPHTRFTGSKIVILAGNTPLCPDYRMATRNGFAAPARPFGASSASTVTDSGFGSLTFHDPRYSCLTKTKTNSSKTQAAVARLSDTLLSYSNRGWKQVQRHGPLFYAAGRYL